MMMGKLHSAANHIIIKIIFVIIILSFVGAGIGSYLGFMDDSYVAKVNGEKISQVGFERAFQQVAERNNINSTNEQERSEKLNKIRSDLLDEQINLILLNQYKNEKGLAIPDVLIEKNILETPQFQNDGHFSNELYKQALKASGYTPDMYVRDLRAYMVQSQLMEGVVLSDFSLPVDSDVSLLRQQVRVIYTATLDSDKLLPEQHVTDKDIEQYYQLNQNNYIHPEQVKTDYVYIEKHTLLDKVKVTDKEIADYYNAHKSELNSPERSRYGLILVKTEDDAKLVQEKLEKGDNFNQLSAEYSMYSFLKDKRGEFGWFEQGKEPEALKQANLTKVGQLSTVMPFDSGFAIFKLEEHEKAKEFTLAESKTHIHNKIQNQKLDSEFLTVQQKMQQAVSDHEPLSEIAKTLDIKVESTNWFSITHMPYGFDGESVKQAIFSSGLYDENGPVDNTSDVVVSGDRAFIFKVTEHRDEGIIPLDEIKSQVLSKLKRDRVRTQLTEKAESILAELKKGNRKALTDYQVSFKNRSNLTLESKDVSSSLLDKVFSMPYGVGGSTMGYDISGESIVFFDLIQVRNATEEKDLSDEMLNRWVLIGHKAFLDNLRSQASIKIDDAEKVRQ